MGLIQGAATVDRLREEIQGVRYRDATSTFCRLMTEQDRHQHDAYMERFERTGVPHIIGIGREVRARRKDGSSFPAFLSVGRIAASVPPRYVGFIQDMTLRHQAATWRRRKPFSWRSIRVGASRS